MNILTNLNLYGLCLALAVAICFLVWQKITKDNIFKIKNDDLVDLLFYIFISAIIFGRLFYVLSFWDFYADNLSEIYRLWHGGIAFYGVLTGGLLALSLWTKRFSKIKKVDFKQTWLFLLDSIFLVLPLGQAIGRFGNFFNEELFGLPSNLPWAIFVSPENRPAEYAHQTHFHPTFIYESILSLIIFLVLSRFFRISYVKKSEPQQGFILSLFLICHGLIRFGLEFLRIDPQFAWLGIRQYGWLALLELLIGIILFWHFQQKNGKIKQS